MTDIWQGGAALVTGGGTGIGRATSLALAARGAKVAVVYGRSRQEAEDTVAEIARAGGTAIALRADMRSEPDLIAAVAATVEAFGGLRYLVNNAGATRQLDFANLDAITDDAWDELTAINVRGPFHAVRAALPHLKRAGGAVVNVGSIAGETGFGSSIPYAASKAAMHSLTRSLARALAPDVRVNAIAPGAVGTRWWAGAEDKMARLAGHVPLARVSTPEDIAETILMLLGAASMTGQVIRADNGQSL